MRLLVAMSVVLIDKRSKKRVSSIAIVFCKRRIACQQRPRTMNVAVDEDCFERTAVRVCRNFQPRERIVKVVSTMVSIHVNYYTISGFGNQLIERLEISKTL